jgi:DNA-binding CsgD family transcriptional regulator
MQTFEDLINRVRAFQESRALLTAIELDLFSAVRQGATAAEVASRLQTDERATEMLMNARVAFYEPKDPNGKYPRHHHGRRRRHAAVSLNPKTS